MNKEFDNYDEIVNMAGARLNENGIFMMEDFLDKDICKLTFEKDLQFSIYCDPNCTNGQSTLSPPIMLDEDVLYSILLDMLFLSFLQLLIQLLN